MYFITNTRPRIINLIENLESSIEVVELSDALRRRRGPYKKASLWQETLENI